jgi:hypothetical protein
VLGALVILTIAGYATVELYAERPELTPSTLAIGLGALALVVRTVQVRRVTERGEEFLSLLRREALRPRDIRRTDLHADRSAAAMALFGWNRLNEPGDAEFRSLVLLSGGGLVTPPWNSSQTNERR